MPANNRWDLIRAFKGYGHLVLHYCCVLCWHSELCSFIIVSVKSRSCEILTLFWYPERLSILYNNFMDMTVEEVLHKQ